jgi:phosphoribosylformylglycinamidine cyclo-ligase
VFRWLRETGGVAETEMLKTFNCGIGMVVVAAADRASALTGLLSDAGERVVRLGHVDKGQGVRYAGTLA